MTIYTLEQLSRIVDGLAETDVNKLDVNAMNSNASTGTGLNAGGTRTVVEVSSRDILPSWYRVYSDGWCEQGGVIPSGTDDLSYIVSLMKAYSSTNYHVGYTSLGDNSSTYQCAWQAVKIYPLTSSTVGAVRINFARGWRAEGYIN